MGKKVLRTFLSEDTREGMINMLASVEADIVNDSRSSEIAEMFKHGLVGFNELSDLKLFNKFLSYFQCDKEDDDSFDNETLSLYKKAEGELAVYKMLTSKPKKKKS
jgi:hypothetical protein